MSRTSLHTSPPAFTDRSREIGARGTVVADRMGPLNLNAGGGMHHVVDDGDLVLPSSVGPVGAVAGWACNADRGSSLNVPASVVWRSSGDLVRVDG